MPTVTIPNILVEGVLVSVTDEFGPENPLEHITSIVQWLKDQGLNQARPSQTAPSTAPSRQAAPPQGGPGGGGGYRPQSGQSNGNRQYSGGGGGYRSGGGRPSGGGYSGGNRQQNSGGWSCPIHGSEKIGDGYRGGQECKVYSDYQEDWTKDRPYMPKDGSPERFYCREASQ